MWEGGKERGEGGGRRREGEKKEDGRGGGRRREVAGERGRELEKVVQLCPTLCHPVDYTVHGILQARILE